MARIADLAISSPDLEPDAAIDPRFAGRSGAVPRLEVSGVPEDAVELAVIVHDPDAPSQTGFTHWAVYGLPPEDGPVSAGSPGVRVGRNSAGSADYMPPNPPRGHGVHHYEFRAYALDTSVEGAPSREQFLARYEGHVLEQARLVGTYSN
ncbi:YbhB/YbcL family Raf kinase inhibitor-like protein [Agromyces sp. NPDC056523]|uniref:YbhB/YbcL family Raf kinase inhibitor-like protein n=1 Tax=Agromyces sp. NPDC056523 TaxID=3345850 RepID=UPI00366F6E80